MAKEKYTRNDIWIKRRSGAWDYLCLSDEELEIYERFARKMKIRIDGQSEA